MKRLVYLCFSGLILLSSGCRSVSDATRMKHVGEEGNLVFVRPDRYTILGSRSLSQYVEIVYEKMTVDEHGKAHVTVGVRNVGGHSWYDLKGPSFTLGATIAFYKTPGPDSAPIYRSNQRSYVIQRGETAHLAFDCPVAGAASYQIVFSDY